MSGERLSAADWLPSAEFSERHATTVEAPAEAVGRAVRAVTLGEVRGVQVLWALRTLPAMLRRRSAPAPASGPLIDQLVRLGGVILVDRPGCLVAGLGGRFWQAAGELERFGSPAEFLRWDAAGSCKATVEFVWSGEAPVRLETTTLVHAPTPAARRSFARYWRIVRPGSGLIRILLLRAIKRRAERDG